MMKRHFIFLVLFCLPFFNAMGQQNILDQPDILEKVEKCLYYTYGCDFAKATAVQKELMQSLPDHPAPYFLQALIIYWQHFPLLPDDPTVNMYKKAIEKTIALSQTMIQHKESEMEGIFFDMHARAFNAMFWADNGRISKVITDVDNMYRSTLKGIDYKDQFNEFYFSSGLYNYYVEAYGDKHPGYKPLLEIFRQGNKQLGIKELQIAIDSTTYIKYEALLFMSLLQLNYEMNIDSAEYYMKELYDLFPKNIYFFSEYLIILLHNRKYELAAELNKKLSGNSDNFHRMIYYMVRAFLQENQQKNYTAAKINYNRVFNYSEKFGPIADLYAAIAYAGLYRIADREKDFKEAKRYRKLSAHYSYYDFVLAF